MKAGTKVDGVLIVDSRFTKNTDLNTSLSVQLNSLNTAIHGEGLEIYELGKPRNLTWDSEQCEQIRQDFRLVLTKNLTKDQVYEVVNKVRAQPLKFRS